MVDILNRFGTKGGFTLVQEIFERDNLDPVSMAALLKPLGNCAELLNKTIVCPLLHNCMEKAVNYVTTLGDNDLKHKV